VGRLRHNRQGQEDWHDGRQGRRFRAFSKLRTRSEIGYCSRARDRSRGAHMVRISECYAATFALQGT
jgi:hypothetical protein